MRAPVVVPSGAFILITQTRMPQKPRLDAGFRRRLHVVALGVALTPTLAGGQLRPVSAGIIFSALLRSQPAA